MNDEDIIIDWTNIIGNKSLCLYAPGNGPLCEIDEEDVNFNLIHQAIELLRKSQHKSGIYKHNGIEWVEI